MKKLNHADTINLHKQQRTQNDSAEDDSEDMNEIGQTQDEGIDIIMENTADIDTDPDLGDHHKQIGLDPVDILRRATGIGTPMAGMDLIEEYGITAQKTFPDRQ